MIEGSLVGWDDGDWDGFKEGPNEGDLDGTADGDCVGLLVGKYDGIWVGEFEGDNSIVTVMFPVSVAVWFATWFWPVALSVAITSTWI